jgi:hypothetical protein
VANGPAADYPVVIGNPFTIAVASKLGTNVSKLGNFWFVRLGPYASQADGLAKAKAAVYGDARIQRTN